MILSARVKQCKKVLSEIRQVAPTDSSVLISGESGTGKELLARGALSVRLFYVLLVNIKQYWLEMDIYCGK
ncbi:sigma 54-interacting transcriptional regulator [Dyadobacter flavalbus]|uniref:sigma 54-interacting transcriptional regulator n=1 Tax=Dyadobacter flavalbus TaxID=2579942 RepID=UPI00191BF88E|nr:sigma 54-interacting transcriptional regulator [Dyadobacter flavalbus]